MIMITADLSYIHNSGSSIIAAVPRLCLLRFLASAAGHRKRFTDASPDGPTVTSALLSLASTLITLSVTSILMLLY